MSGRKEQSFEQTGFGTTFGRRAWMRGLATLTGGIAGAKFMPAAQATPARAGAPAIHAAAGSGTVETTAGKINGYTSNGIFTFKGIPYGASTGGSARWMAPSKPKPWAGVRSTKQYGPVAYQAPRSGWAFDEVAFVFEWEDGLPSEDCLRANVWTPAVNDNKKRPVMVWLHGGGFSTGSSQELKAYDGESLARRGDVVVVSFNHRLNVLGYLNLAEMGGEKYAASGNAGVLDLQLGLEWIRDNIERFGGDPGNVLIFGQSGGGSKVTTLTAMPGAKGLLHRAVVESAGSALRQTPFDVAAKMAAALVAELGVSASQLDRLQDVPYQKLLDASLAAQRKLGPGFGWAPTVDGKILPRHPYDPAAPEASANVPLLIGNVLNEQSPINSGDPEIQTIDELKAKLSPVFRERTDNVIQVFQKFYPKAKMYQLLTLITAENGHRKNAIIQAERKFAQKAAPVWMYWFTWQTPILDGRPGAFHCSELPFVFNNSDRASHMTGGGSEARELAGKVSDAWINFARKGDPNHSGLPAWPSFNPDQRPTMVFDTKCEVKNDPDRELRLLMRQG